MSRSQSKILLSSLLRREPRVSARFEGAPVSVSFRPSPDSLNGAPVHAASYIRKREIVLELPLRTNAPERRRILVHELCHFAWVRLGNPARDDYADLLAAEGGRRAAGELGWSAESLKIALRGRNSLRRWREYVCESFCDSGAWLYAGLENHEEWTLKPRFRGTRAEWFHKTFPDRRIPI